MKQHKSRDEAMKQTSSKITLFVPVKHKDRGVMRPGKTKKDKAARSKRMESTDV